MFTLVIHQSVHLKCVCFLCVNYNPVSVQKVKGYIWMEGYRKSKHCQESWVLILTSTVNGLWFGNVTSGAGVSVSSFLLNDVWLDALRFSQFTVTSLSFLGGEKGGMTVGVENQLKSKCLDHKVIIKTHTIKLLQIQDDTLYYSNTKLEQQVLSVFWGADDGGNHYAPLLTNSVSMKF